MKTRVIQNDPDDRAVATAPEPRTPPPQARRRTGRIVAGALTAIVGVGALAGGGALIGAHVLWLGIGVLVAGAALAGAGVALIASDRRPASQVDATT